MGDIARRGNRLTKGINYDKAYVKSRSIVKDVYDAVAPKHSPGQKKKPHSSKEGRTASLGRTVRDVGKILSPDRDKKFGGGRTNLLEELGRVEAEPSNRNRRAEISRVHGELNRGYKTGGRVGLKHGGKPWGDKPKPGTHEYMMQEIHKRKGKAAGGILKVGKQAIQKIISKIRKKPETTWKELDIPGYPPIHKGKYPGIDKAMENVKKHGDIRGKIGKAAGGRIGLKHGFQALGGGVEGKPHSSREGRDDAGRRRFKRWTGEDWSKGPGSRRKGRRMGRPGRGKDFKTHGRDVTTMAAEGGRIGLKKGGSDKNWIQKATASIKKRGTKGKCTPITKPGCTGRAKALAKTFKKIAKRRKG